MRGGLQAAAAPAQELAVAIALVHCFVEIPVAGRRIAVAGKTQGRLGVEGLAIPCCVAHPLHRAARTGIKVGERARGIDRHCADFTQVLADAQCPRSVEFADHEHAVQCGVPVRAHGQGTLPEQGLFLCACRVVASQRGTVAPHTLAQLVGQCRVRLDEPAHLAVLLGQHHLQFATARGAQVIDDVRARTDVSGIDRIAVLPDFQFRAALCHASDNGGVTLLRVREHGQIRGYAHARNRDAAKHIAAGEGFTQGQVGVGAGQIALDVSLASGPFLQALVVLAPGLSAAQAPLAEIQAAVEVQIVAAGAASCATVTLLGGRLVIEESGIDAAIPLLWVDVPSHVATHGNLRDR